MNEVAGLAVDARSLARLRQQATSDPKTAAREAAKQFESLFMQQMLKSMREAMPRSGLMDGPGQSTYREMLDGQLAQLLSGRPGGLADVLARQLSQNMGLKPATTAADGAAAAPAALKALSPAPAPLKDLAFPAAPSARISTVGALPESLVRALGGAVDASAPGAAAASAAADSTAAQVPPGTSPAQVDFVRRLFPHARAAEQQTGVRAEFIVGQAALESGWGKGEMRLPNGQPAYNLFGIKAGAGWSGRTVDVLTTEYEDGKARKVVEKFRAYDSYAHAFTDWARLMSANPRYGEVLKAGASPRHFANGLQQAGYATDPNYARKLERTIERTIELRRMQI